jgi:hypothetical protein
MTYKLHSVFSHDLTKFTFNKVDLITSQLRLPCATIIICKFISIYLYVCVLGGGGEEEGVCVQMIKLTQCNRYLKLLYYSSN